MGHSDEVARQHYLRVNEDDLDAATHTRIGAVLTQKLTQTEETGAETDNAADSQPAASQELNEKAGDRIRTDDVQLGKLAFYH